VANKSIKSVTIVPLKTFVEKAGTFVNHAGVSQTFKKVTTVVSEALTVTEAAALLAGQDLHIETVHPKNLLVAANKPADQVTLDFRKKNEFVFQRGKL
jgi:NADH-quinone oxidoreductase subunit G